MGKASRYEMDQPVFWKNVEVGDVLTLKDFQGMEDAMNLNGLDYKVESIREIKESNDMCIWLLFSLKNSKQDLILMAKIVDSDLDLKVFFNIPDLVDGTRDDLLREDMHWVFKEPRNVNNFNSCELEYIDEIFFNQNDEGSGESQEIIYRMKPQGVLHGSSKINPNRSGISDGMDTIVEYSTQSDCKNPELLILEESNARNFVNGGYITIFMGCRISPSEIVYFDV